MTIEKLYLQELFTKLGNYCQYQQQIQAVCLVEEGLTIDISNPGLSSQFSQQPG